MLIRLHYNSLYHNTVNTFVSNYLNTLTPDTFGVVIWTVFHMETETDSRGSLKLKVKKHMNRFLLISLQTSLVCLWILLLQRIRFKLVGTMWNLKSKMLIQCCCKSRCSRRQPDWKNLFVDQIRWIRRDLWCRLHWSTR